MNFDLTITSLQNQRIKQTVKLRQRSHRDAGALMLVEGCREIRCALDNNYHPKQLFVCPDFFLSKNETALIADCRAVGAEVLHCLPAVFAKIAYRARPEGVLGVFPQFHFKLDNLTPQNEPLYLMTEALEKPGNLGTILRSADAAGADAVIVCDPCTDIFNPNVIRASIGTIFAVPVVTANSETVLKWLRQHQINVLAATPHAKCSYTQVALTGAVAIALGSEQSGLSDFWMQAANIQVRIPMLGQADSLNVAAAATILLFEARRQRAGSL